MSTPYTLSGTLQAPPTADCPDAFSISGQFDALAEFHYILTGAGTQVVDFGTITKAKIILIQVAEDAAAPVDVTINGGTDIHEISAGGLLAYSNPTPVGGISAMSIAHADDADVSVKILG
jgi:hypothetical protein